MYLNYKFFVCGRKTTQRISLGVFLIKWENGFAVLIINIIGVGNRLYLYL